MPVISVDSINNISKLEFIKEYQIPLQPVVLKNITKDWSAHKKWSLPYFKKMYGGTEVSVSDYGLTGSPKTKMPLSKYIDYLNDGLSRKPEKLYLSNWQAFKDIPELLNDISPIQIFERDWLDESSSPEMFWIFLGHENAEIGLHVDVGCTSAWLTMIQGKKLFRLINQDVIHTIESLDRNRIFEDAYIEEKIKSGRVFEAFLEAGDTIFIPSGWWHAVRNIDVTIAVTRNFVDFYSYRNFELKIFADLDRKKKQIKKDFSEKISNSLKNAEDNAIFKLKIDKLISDKEIEIRQLLSLQKSIQQDLYRLVRMREQSI